MTKPHHFLETFSCDTIAETWDNISDHLTNRLWEVLSLHGKPLKQLIDIEESSPCDALGCNTPAEFWEHFTPEEQEELNRCAEQTAKADNDRW